MNKAHSMMAAFSLVLGALVLVPALNIAFAQYAAPAGKGGVTLEEQLQLAKEKISNAQQQGAYGSGHAMFGSNLDNTLIPGELCDWDNYKGDCSCILYIPIAKR